MTSRKRKAAVLTTISFLAERFPAAFSVHEGRRRPLKVRIATDILDSAPEISSHELQWALAGYCMSSGYLQSLTKGAARIDLEGEASGSVSDEAAARALAMLEQKRAAGRRHDVKVEERPVVTLAPSRSTALRTSIQAIREAAQRRRMGLDAGSSSRRPVEQRVSGPVHANPDPARLPNERTPSEAMQ